MEESRSLPESFGPEMTHVLSAYIPLAKNDMHGHTWAQGWLENVIPAQVAAPGNNVYQGEGTEILEDTPSMQRKSSGSIH